MPNPIANLFNFNVQQPVAYNPNNMQGFMEFANKYRNQNPQQIVQNLLKSGRMTQEQFNQFSQIANSLTGRN